MEESPNGGEDQEQEQAKLDLAAEAKRREIEEDEAEDESGGKANGRKDREYEDDEIVYL